MFDPIAFSAVEALLCARYDCIAVAMPTGPATAEALLSRVVEGRIDLAILQAESDLEALAALREARPSLPVVAVILGDPDLAFKAARLGAADILSLPLKGEEWAAKLNALIDGLRASLSSAGAAANGTGAAEALIEPAPVDFTNSLIASRRMAEIRDMIEKVATTSATVLIRGESGVGKEIVARMIFAQSGRSNKPFVKVNCAAIPNDLLESELFGFEAGAFTGAQRPKPGKFEIANGGPMFLDAIAEMHPMLQAKLLHVLQDGEFSRLGSKHDTSVDVRVVCATNKLLEQRVAEGLFREDLFYRVNVVTIHIPPLRERPEEIPVLVDYFIRKYSSVYRRTVAPLGAEVMEYLNSYSWPGNIRELENLCKRYVIVGGAEQIVQELSARTRRAPDGKAPVTAVRAAGPAVSLLETGRQAAWRAEREAIKDMLMQTHWNRKEAARRLQVSYKALLNKIEQMTEEDTAYKENPFAS